ncbi:MAG TPA: class I SAM-dependent methyltransferase [Fimbriimonadaceae bacterium]|nr:class I SAM-dependent methyltransferase [Fimbriimonadaceae bacterium]
MNPDEYRRMFELESHYWWFVARRRLAFRLLRMALPEVVRPRILDLGCGTGAFDVELSRYGDPVGADMSRLALDLAHSRGSFDLVQADGSALPFKAGTFDASIGLDVFEHIENDAAALAECSRVLRPGGVLVLTVPAFRTLWGPHDVALHHFRRYRRAEVRERLVAAGLHPIRLSYSVFFLFPLVLLVRLFEKRKRGPAEASLPIVPRWLNSSLIGLGDVEAALITRLALPWGSSVVAVARKHT